MIKAVFFSNKKPSITQMRIDLNVSQNIIKSEEDIKSLWNGFNNGKAYLNHYYGPVIQTRNAKWSFQGTHLNTFMYTC